jgi:hypothetical protein
LNSQNQQSTFNQSVSHSVNQSWREQRHAAHLAHRENRKRLHTGHTSGWIGGTILILVGFVFLMQNMGVQFPKNWWALLFLLPAYAAYTSAWNCYQESGQNARVIASALIIGISLNILTLVLLFNLAVSFLWPVLLITGGLVLLMKALV